jgi:hypothetical protein
VALFRLNHLVHGDVKCVDRDVVWVKLLCWGGGGHLLRGLIPDSLDPTPLTTVERQAKEMKRRRWRR